VIKYMIYDDMKERLLTQIKKIERE